MTDEEWNEIQRRALDVSFLFDDYEDDPMVCASHVSHVPCRKGHEGDEWGVGCEFSTDPYVVALVGAWHRGWISEHTSLSGL